MAYGENFFADGQAYDRAMGRLSRIAGERFLEWLSMPASLRWLDVGCGSGSFTELILQRGAPSTISATACGARKQGKRVRRLGVLMYTAES